MTETLRSCRSRHPLCLRPGRGYVDPHCDDDNYGLAAYLWTHDISSGLRAAHVIESGWVQVNQGGGQALGHFDGGYKQSGIGREFSLEACSKASPSART
jgi:acyl-CoA reductase-like NAD-dependent aldehyde dehydrogenase